MRNTEQCSISYHALRQEKLLKKRQSVRPPKMAKIPSCPRWPWALGPGSRALGPGPKIRKMKITKSTSAVKKNPRTFRMARIGPSRQVVMKEAIWAGPGIFSGPKMKKKFKKASKPADIRFHPPSTAYFPFKGDNRQPYFPFKGLFSLTGISTRWGYDMGAQQKLWGLQRV